MKKIYIAGPMSDGSCINFLANIRKGIRVSVELLLLGYAPFSPFIDFQFFLALRNNEQITGEHIKEYSMEWLEVCDAVLVLYDFKNSVGTIAEIAKAMKLEIPIYYSLEELRNHFENTKES